MNLTSLGLDGLAHAAEAMVGKAVGRKDTAALQAMVNLTNWNWPHTFVMPKYASMVEYKQFAPANHFHMTWGLPVARLQYWMDLTGILSVAPWAARPRFVEGVDRPQPLVHLINGGEDTYKMLTRK